MKIYFDNVSFGSNTGPNTFAHRLASQLGLMGHDIVGHKERYDIFLCFIEPTIKPEKRCKFIHRLDGIWFKPEQFHTHNQMIKWAYDNSDSVIWQSRFDKEMTEHHWGTHPGVVIHNGIALGKANTFQKNILSIRKSYKRVFACSANWHRQKRLKENTDLFLKLKEKYPDSCLIVMGSNPDHYVKHKDIFYTGSIPHSICSEVFSIADWMIHLAWLDHCPNVVVEALGSGCPVICTDSGGTAEIVRENGVIINESKKYQFELCDYDNPPGINAALIDLPEIKVKTDYLKIESIAKKYLEVFNGKI